MVRKLSDKNKFGSLIVVVSFPIVPTVVLLLYAVVVSKQSNVY